jgi:anti-sigma factor RsiW
MNANSHLTEEERHLLVDGTLGAERTRELEAHLADCDACATDVSRLRNIMKRYQDASKPETAVDELWPSIRSRIEQDKVVPLGAAPPVAHRRWLTVRHAVAIVALAAAAMLTIVLVRPSRRIPVEPTTAEVSDTSALRLVADSVKSYEDEARVLLNRLEVQRAMLRPDAAASIDRDLKVIDSAIAELQEAIRNDPRNAALRHLLAASYRQKIDLLKRASNAS